MNDFYDDDFYSSSSDESYSDGSDSDLDDIEIIDIIIHPLIKGNFYMCRRADDTYRIAQILEVKTGPGYKYEYLVHFKRCNRRLDEWVGPDAFDHAATRNYNLGIPEKRCTRLQKKKEEMEKEEKAVKKSKKYGKKKKAPKVRNIQYIQFGKYEMETWFFSPYPDEYAKQKKLYICEYCLKYMRLEKTYRFHQGECIHRHPPGKEIYSQGDISVYEIDGVDHKLYCQFLCLMAKLFLDHKALYYDVEPFLFYILTERDKHGTHLVGYFSKEKESPDGNNVACILTLPPFQRKGFGRFLIAFSYELSKRENAIGSPEKPLSDLGKLSYFSYWAWVILHILKECSGILTVVQLSEMTAITQIDIIYTLQKLNLLRYWKGQQTIILTPDVLEEVIEQMVTPRIPLDTNLLIWSPRTLEEEEEEYE